MTLRSLAPCLRAAREKHRFAAGKNIGTEKTRLAAGKKRLAAGKSCFRSGKKRQQKMPLRSGKNSKQQKKHLAAAQKHLCSRKNAFWRQREKTVRGGKKPVRGKKKTGRGRRKTSSRESPALQPKKLPQRKKYISATGKSSSPIKTGPPRRHRILCSRSMPWTRQHCSEGNWRCPGPLPALLSRAPARSKERLHGSFWSWNHQISAPRTVHPCFLATVRTFDADQTVRR